MPSTMAADWARPRTNRLISRIAAVVRWHTSREDV